jgi:hypothetical protein
MLTRIAYAPGFSLGDISCATSSRPGAWGMSPSHVIAQHQFGWIGVHVRLVFDPGRRVTPEVMLQQGQRHHQGHQALPVVFNARHQFRFVSRVERFLEPFPA